MASASSDRCAWACPAGNKTPQQDTTLASCRGHAASVLRRWTFPDSLVKDLVDAAEPKHKLRVRMLVHRNRQLANLILPYETSWAANVKNGYDGLASSTFKNMEPLLAEQREIEDEILSLVGMSNTESPGRPRKKPCVKQES